MQASYPSSKLRATKDLENVNEILKAQSIQFLSKMNYYIFWHFYFSNCVIENDDMQ